MTKINTGHSSDINAGFDSWWRALHHVLDRVRESRLDEILILRGSLLMRAWYGSIARLPDDVDWVLRDGWVGSQEREFNLRWNDLLRLLKKSTGGDGIAINTEKINDEEIIAVKSDYESMVGRRVRLPWKDREYGKRGVLQFDIAFDEQLRVEPSLTEIPNLGGVPTPIFAAGKDESLAWKLFWLQRDAERWTRHNRQGHMPAALPRGKDLYDAVLLAEDTLLPMKLYLQVLYPHVDHCGYTSEQFDSDLPHTHYFPLLWEVDWESFQREDPQVEGTAMEWQMRLAAALEPTFTDEEKARAIAALAL